jgi:hypothetical protein
MKLHVKKCVFGLQKTEYLGNIVSGGKLYVSAKKVEAVTE